MNIVDAGNVMKLCSEGKRRKNINIIFKVHAYILLP